MIGKLDGLSPPSLPRSTHQSGQSHGSADFSTVLSRFTDQTIATIHQGEIAAEKGIKGEMPVADVVEKVMAAEQALQAGIALRDKVVAAYLEISRMTI